MESAIFSKIKREEIIPEFHLKNIRSEAVSSDRFLRKKNLVILFFNRIQDSCCSAYLEMLNSIYQDLQNANSEVLAISQEDSGALKEFAQEIKIKFNILLDSDREVINKFTYKDKQGNNICALFITDKYNSLYRCYLHSPFGELPDKDEIIGSVEFLEKLCPECGVGENEG